MEWNWKNLTFNFKEDTLQIKIHTPDTNWITQKYRAYLLTDERKLYFHDIKSISHIPYKNGIGEGILTHYLDDGLAFDTIIWSEYRNGTLHFEWIPIKEDKNIKEVVWPSPMEFEAYDSHWYSLLNLQQGLLLPNTWKEELTKLPFDGQFASSSAYMPWFGQIKNRNGYMCICETYWDCAYSVEHPANGPYTNLFLRWLPSMGHMCYPRKMQMHFYQNCDYNTLCKEYRLYAEEKGKVTTLKEKCAKNPLVDKLIGSGFVHMGIKTFVQKDSSFYDQKDPEKNNSITSFSKRAEEILHYKQQGIKKLYLHLDGWAQYGYDNNHPDILPACEEAGGWEGLKALSDTIKNCNYMLGLHDQYRDYYHRAASYDPAYSVHTANAKRPSHASWAGGHQDYLCSAFAPLYVKRNYTEILAHNIHLEGSYLDVFTCNEPDECIHPYHPVSRRQCLDNRLECFSYMQSQGILPSSEEVNEWALSQLVYCHYAPYDFQMHASSEPRKGIPVPLFNLVYHDCVLIPWPMEKQKGGDDFMLYALLNGGGAYLRKDAAYPNTDGMFENEYEKLSEEECIKRCQIVAQLQEKVAYQKMVHHEFIHHDPHLQKTVFEDGTTITIDLYKQTFKIQ